MKLLVLLSQDSNIHEAFVNMFGLFMSIYPYPPIIFHVHILIIPYTKPKHVLPNKVNILPVAGLFFTKLRNVEME